VKALNAANVGGDSEEAPPTLRKAVVSSDLKSAEVRMPSEPGIYRLYALAYDAHDGAAVANLPFTSRGR
jgi:hypothetical protein